MDTLNHYLTKLRASLLAVPLLMAFAAVALAQAMLELEHADDWPDPHLHRRPGAAGAGTASPLQRDAALGQLEAILEAAQVDRMIARDADAVRQRYRGARAVLGVQRPQAADPG